MPVASTGLTTFATGNGTGRPRAFGARGRGMRRYTGGIGTRRGTIGGPFSTVGNECRGARAKTAEKKFIFDGGVV